MSSDLALSTKDSALVVIDVQERLAAVMPEGGAACVRNVDALLEGARLLGVPVLVTEQYPKGLGPTVPVLRDRLASFASPPPRFEKVEFAATSNAAFNQHLDSMVARGLGSVVVTGMEAHICVYQTVRGLMSRGLSVHVAADATASRSAHNLEVGRGLWTRCGAIVSSTETVLFDLLGKAGSDEFKAISRIVK